MSKRLLTLVHEHSSPNAVLAKRPRKESLSPIPLNFRVRGLGNVRAHFVTKRNKTWQSKVTGVSGTAIDNVEPILIQGTLQIGREHSDRNQGRVPVAASIIDNNLNISFINGTRTSEKRKRYYRLQAKLSDVASMQARISAKPASSFPERSCASDHIDQDHLKTEQGRVEAASSNLPGTKIIELFTDADTEWFNTFGANSNAQIAAIVNETETLYQSDLGLSIDIVGQHVFASNSPYTALDSANLLIQFRDYARTQDHLGIADLYHLFTTKYLGSSLGVAYIRVACRYTPNSADSLLYGVNVYAGSITPNIVAHEIGHNLGGTHDVGSLGSIMYPSVTSPPAVSTGFSAFSKQEIGSYIGTYGNCLSPVDATPTPSPTTTPSPSTPTLLLKQPKSKGNIYSLAGLLRAASGEGYPNQTINIFLGQTITATLTTDESGRYSTQLTIKLKPGKSIKVNAVHSESGIKSATIKIKRAKHQRDENP